MSKKKNNLYEFHLKLNLDKSRDKEVFDYLQQQKNKTEAFKIALELAKSEFGDEDLAGALNRFAIKNYSKSFGHKAQTQNTINEIQERQKQVKKEASNNATKNDKPEVKSEEKKKNKVEENQLKKVNRSKPKPTQKPKSDDHSSVQASQAPKNQEDVEAPLTADEISKMLWDGDPDTL